MDKLIKGKAYFVSDKSKEKAEEYRIQKNTAQLCIYLGEGQYFTHVQSEMCWEWRYWVAEEEEEPVHTDPRTRCAEYVVEATESLIASCMAVGGCPPNMDMTLKEFLSIYGWNGVGFTVLEGKKKEMER